MTPLLPAALGLLIQSTLLLLLGIFVLSLARRRGPAVQSFIGRAALAGVGLLLMAAPLAGHINPVWRVTLPAASPPNPIPVLNPAPQDWGGGASLPSTAAGGQTSLPAKAVPSPNVLPPPPPRPESDAPTTRPSPLRLLYPALAVVWGLGTALLLLWLGVCQWHLTRLRRGARPITSGLAADMLVALTPRPPRLLSHPSVRSPFLAGLWHPAIFLPAAYEAEFEPTALRAVLAHELAHVARRDTAWTLAARLLCALLWPQPLLWLLCRRLDGIGEEACDQAVLARDCPPRAYADCLLSLAERHPLGRRERALGAGVTPFRSSLGRRISYILAKGTHAMPAVSARLRLTIAAITLAAALSGAFLVSSAPAQSAKPAPVHAGKPSLIGTWLWTYSDGTGHVTIFSSDGRIEVIGPFPYNSQWVGHSYGRYAVGGSTLTYALTRVWVEGQPAWDTDPERHVETYALSGDVLTLRMKRKGGDWVYVNRRVPAYTRDMLGIKPAPVAQTSEDGTALTPAMRREYQAQQQDILNLKEIGGALKRYAQGHGGRLPDADHWMDQLAPDLSGPTVFFDPFLPGRRRYGYAFNRNFSNQPLPALGRFDDLVVVFDSPFGTRNANDTGESVRSSQRPTDKALLAGSGYLFAAGPAYWLGPGSSLSFSLQALAAARQRRQLEQQHFMKAFGPTRSDALGQARLLAGLTPVQGPGVVVTLRDSRKPSSQMSPNAIHDTDINQIVHELKVGGTEAIAVNGQRPAVTSSIRAAGPILLINSSRQRRRSPSRTSATRKPLASAMFSIKEMEALTLPGYSGGREARYARPVADQSTQAVASQKTLDFLDAQIRVIEPRLRKSEWALSVFRAGHQSATLRSQRRQADLARKYDAAFTLYGALVKQRQMLQIQTKVDRLNQLELRHPAGGQATPPAR